MKTISLGCAVVLLTACGGTGDTGIPDGGGDGNSSDVTSSDSSKDSPSDAPNDTANDSGDASDGGGFNPANVPNLVLWLEANIGSSITTMTGDGGTPKVVKWADQTTHTNDAIGLSGFLARNPTVKANAINSLPAIHFTQGSANQISGNMLTITDNADTSLQWGHSDFYVAIVGDYDNDPTKGQTLGVGNFFSKAMQPGSSGYTGVLFYGNIPSSTVNPNVGLLFGTASSANDFVVSSNTYNNGTAHLFALRRQSNKLDLFVDGTSVASSTSSGVDVSAAKVPIRIGADGDANLVKLDGDIGEILAVKGALAPSDESGIEGYLKSKWATP